MPTPFTSPADLVRGHLVRRVRRVFNDAAKGERPVERSADAYFPPDSVIWRVHGDLAAMMVGGIAALLLQMLHPLALAGVIGHSTFRTDMLGRLRRTSRFVAQTTYAARGDADAAVARVRAIHARVNGTLPDGRGYSADDPHLLAWVHIAEVLMFLAGHLRYVDPAMSRADQDTYVAQAALVARQLGADPVPTSVAEAAELLAGFRPELAGDAPAREVAGLILNGAAGRPAASHALVGQAAIGLLPAWAREMLALAPPPWRAAGAEAGTHALAATLRWAFAGPPSRAARQPFTPENPI